MPDRIESRITRTDVTPEKVIGVVPSGATAKWRPLDLNSYSDASVSYDSQARAVMTSGRRLKKGTQTDKTVQFGYNIDNTGDNVLAQICAFLYNTPVEHGVTRSILDGSVAVSLAPIAITAKAAGSITAAATLLGKFVTDDIVILQDGVNDRTPLRVTGAVTTALPVAPLNAGAALDVTTPLPNDARVIKVGKVFTGEELTLQGAADKVTLTATTTNWATLGLRVGEWVHVGGDNAFFASTEPFYARVASINGLVLTFDSTSRAISTVAVKATGVEFFIGTYVFDGDTSISFTHARYFGKDDNGKHIREFYVGCIPSEMAINLEEKSFVTCDFTYNGMDGYTQLYDDAAHAAQFATNYPEYSGAAISTVTDIVRQRFVVNKAGVVNPAAIHGFIKNGTVNINNNITMESAQGVLGSIGGTAGDFTATGSVTAYFVNTAALEAIRCNCTVGMDLIAARGNAGFVLDIPEMTLGNGALTIEKGQSVTIDLDQAAFGSSKFNLTMSYTSFNYLPNKAMPAGKAGCNC